MQKSVNDAARPLALRMGGTEWALLVVQSMLWGSAFFFAELAIPELPPLTITAFRLLPATLIVFTVCFALGARLPATLGEWRRFIMFSSLNNVGPFLLILWAQREVSGGVAAIFNSTAPLFGVFLAHALTHDEKISAAKLAGISTGIIGVAVLVGADVFTGSAHATLAKLALLAAALCYALSGVVVRLHFRQYGPYTMAAGQMAGALMITMPLALLIEHPFALPMPSGTAIGAVAGMGLFSSALAALCYFNLLHRAGATNALLATILLPLTPIGLGAVFLGELLSAREVIGALIIGAALIMIDGRMFRRWQARPRDRDQCA